MKIDFDKDFPIKPLISFDKFLKQYDVMAESDDPLLASKAKQILEVQAPYPELRDGFTDLNLLEKHEELIQFILQDAFSEILGSNEIITSWISGIEKMVLII